MSFLGEAEIKNGLGFHALEADVLVKRLRILTNLICSDS